MNRLSSVRRAAPPIVSLLTALALATGAGCSADTEEITQKLALPDENDAVDFMSRFFVAYINGRLKTALEMMCEQDPSMQARARAFMEQSQAPRSPFRINRFTVRSVVPMWIQREPYYRVEVSFPRNRSPGELLHAYTVRARDGCLEGFLDRPSVPAPLPPALGDESGDDVVEMPDETDAPTVPEPSAGTVEDEEVIEL